MIIKANTPRIEVLRGSFTQLKAAAVESKAWNLLMPRGTWHGANFKQLGGSITIDDALLNALVANWREAGRPPLPVRKTHGHLETDDPVALLELQKSYGLLTDFRVTDAGLEALTEWTPAGAELVKAGEWNFWSPEWAPRFQDRRTGEVKEWWLSGTALTNSPFFNEMPPVAAAVNPTDPPATQEQCPMNEEQLKQLRASLGLAADASVEVVLSAAAKVGAEVKTLKASVEKQPTLTAAVQEAVADATKPLVEQLETLKAEKAKADEALFVKSVDDVIEAAKREGYACEPMRASIVLVAKASGLDEAKKLARAAAKLGATTTGTGGGAGAADTVKASVAEYNRLVDERIKGGQTAAAAARLVNSSHPELAAKAFSATTNG